MQMATSGTAPSLICFGVDYQTLFTRLQVAPRVLLALEIKLAANLLPTKR